jgi:hypothetical protein
MALDPTFQELNLLLYKTQSALGTKQSSLVYTDFVTIGNDFELKYSKEFAEQNLTQGIFGQPQGVAGMSKIDAKITIPIIPTGSATLPNVDPFLMASGMAYTLATYKHSYAPSSVVSGWKDQTLWSYTGNKTSGDSILTKAHSIMFDWELSAEIGKESLMTFTGMGVPDGVPAAATYPTDAVSLLSTVPPAMLKNSTMTINGLTLNILKFSVKIGNEVVLIKGASDESGYIQAMIVGRKSTWTATAYMDNASSNNPLTGMAAGTLATTTIKYGNATNSLVSVTSGSNKSEIIDCPMGNDGKIMTWDFSGKFVDNNFTLAINDA